MKLWQVFGQPLDEWANKKWQVGFLRIHLELNGIVLFENKITDQLHDGIQGAVGEREENAADQPQDEPRAIRSHISPKATQK